MKGLPPELDRLMWALAESDNDQAVSEFFTRHPEQHRELLRRISMVRAIRGEGRRTSDFIPAFQPTRTATASPGRPLSVIAGLAAVIACAAALTAALSYRPIPNPTPPVPVVNVAPIQFNDSPAVNPPAPPSAAPVESPKPPAPIPASVPRYLKPLGRVTISKTSLTLALHLVTDGTGLQLELGPGFQDQEVSFEYDGKNALDIIQDLGKQYAFTVFDEGDGHLLLIPAVERTEPESARRATP